MKSIGLKMILSIFICFPPQVWACSTFQYFSNGQSFLAKSFDFDDESGWVQINPKGLKKQSLHISFKMSLAPEWTARYKSMTFNQVSSQFPFGGMNEKGLIVEILWHEDSKMPNQSDQKQVSINESQLIQFLLDQASSLKEVDSLLKQIRVEKIMAPVHYFVCEASGQCGVLEYLHDKLEFQNATLNILENDTYASSLKSTGTRFEKIKKYRQKLNGNEEPISAGFSGLDQSYQDNWTRWHIIYDQKNLVAHFRTVLNKEVKTLSLNQKSGCEGRIQVYDLNSNQLVEPENSLFFIYKKISRSSFLPWNLKAVASMYASKFSYCQRRLF